MGIQQAFYTNLCSHHRIRKINKRIFTESEWERQLLLNYNNLKIIRDQSSYSGPSLQCGILAEASLTKVSL